MALSSEQFLNQVVASELLAQEDVSAFLSAFPDDRRPKDGEQFARELVRQKKLTKYQAEQIYSGKGKTLILGNYVVLDKLGQGGMGVVLKAEHKRLKRLVALKVMSSDVVKTPDALKRFHREVEAAAKLRHTNVVATDDADEAKGTHFLVMEYVEGSDLSVLVKKNGPLSVSQTVRCILQAARGLEYAHKQGVVHRDIKPANLLLDMSGTVKILDMGLARIEGDTGSQAELTSTGAVMGTVDYMAPEQALSTKHADARSDIYSLGISLWYLLAGRCAYEGDSLMAKLLAHRDAPIPSLCSLDSEIPQTLDQVFRKMVAKQSKDRYQTMTEVIRELESCQSGSASALDVAAPNNYEDPSLQSFLSQLGSKPSTSPAAGKTTEPATRVKINPAAEATMLNGNIGVDTDPQTQGLARKQERQARRGSRLAEAQVASPPWYRDKRILLGGAAAAALILAAVVILMRTPHGTLRVEILDPEVEMKVKGSELTFQSTDVEPVSLMAGDKKLVVTRGDLSFETETFALKKGEETRVKVELIGDKLVVNEGPNIIAEQPIGGMAVTASGTGENPVAAFPKGVPESPVPMKTQETSSIASTTGRSIDLLPWIDVQRDGGVGNWKRAPDGIACENPDGANVMQLPYEPPEEYDFEIEFTATANGLNVNQYVAAGGQIFAWKLNSHNVNPPLYGFELLDGKFAKDNKEAAVQIPDPIKIGRRYRSTVQVRRGSLRTLLDGKELVNWSGDFKRFSTETVTPMKYPGRIGIGSWRRPVTFHSVTVREIAGTGNITAIARETTVASTWIDWLGPAQNQGMFDGNGWTREANGVSTDRKIDGKGVLPAETRDGAIRATYLLRDSGGIQLSARALGAADAREFVYFAEDNGEKIQIAAVIKETNYKLLAEHRVPENIPKDAPRTLEFRVVGDTLTLTLNSSLVLTVKDSTQSEGLFALAGTKGLLIQKVDVQALDKSTPKTSDAAGWRPLFNGKDLAGWKSQGGNGWLVKKGVLTGRTSQGKDPGWLMSEQEFTDYELELEFRLSTGSNSGIFPRAFPTGNISGKDFVEVQLLDDQSPEFASLPRSNRTGGIFGKVAPNPTPVVPADQWHRVRLKLQEKTMELSINNVVVIKQPITDLPAAGHIGLQLYPTQVEFRNIRVRENAPNSKNVGR
jgi:serine/threonine protein kinase